MQFATKVVPKILKWKRMETPAVEVIPVLHRSIGNGNCYAASCSPEIRMVMCHKIRCKITICKSFNEFISNSIKPGTFLFTKMLIFT